MPIAFALGAALLFAVASVLQQRAASQVPATKALRVGLMLHLVRRPMWVAGYAADWGAYALQAAALGTGSLLLVQPLLVTGLLFALPIGAWWAGRRLTRADWIAGGVLAAGLVTFVVLASPSGGSDHATVESWIVVAGITLGLMTACVLAGMRTSGNTRALLFGTATALAYGVTAALTKTSVSLLGNGLGAFFTSWEPYALAVMASIGMVINQSAFQAGSLSASLPAITIVEPIAAAVIGMTLFDERVRASSAPAWLGIALAVAAMIYGVLVLARAEAGVEEIVSEAVGGRPIRPAPGL